MAEAKHSFVDDYPYLVYTNEDTLVYSNKADTSIDDISSGGQEYEIKCYTISGGTPTEIDSIIKLAEYELPPNDDYIPVGDPLTSAMAGTLLYCTDENSMIAESLEDDAIAFPKYKNAFVMPSCDIAVIKIGL